MIFIRAEISLQLPPLRNTSELIVLYFIQFFHIKLHRQAQSDKVIGLQFLIKLTVVKTRDFLRYTNYFHLLWNWEWMKHFHWTHVYFLELSTWNQIAIIKYSSLNTQDRQNGWCYLYSWKVPTMRVPMCARPSLTIWKISVTST